MKVKVLVFSLLALLPFVADAQRGGSSSRGGSSPVATVRSYSNPQSNARAATSVIHAPHNNVQPRSQPTPHGSQPTNFQNRFNFNGNRTFTPTPRQTFAHSQTPIRPQDNHIATRAFHCRGFWPGGILWGVAYAPGWYYSTAIYPGFWYDGPLGYGYRYTVGEPSDLSGIKFDLDQIPKDERRAVSNGQVLLNGDDATNGRVKNFSGISGKVLHLGPGDHDITIEIKGGQKISMVVAVQPGRVTHVALNFNQGSKDGEQSADASSPKDDVHILIAAPAPAPSDTPQADATTN